MSILAKEHQEMSFYTVVVGRMEWQMGHLHHLHNDLQHLSNMMMGALLE